MTLALGCVAALIAVAGLSLFAGGRPPGSRLVYGACLAVSLVALGAMLVQMQAAPERLALPLGLPWIGANFRLDPLAAAFLAVVNLGGAAASLYALGHGEHEPAPMRVLPFYPAFLAGMNLVVLADDRPRAGRDRALDAAAAGAVRSGCRAREQLDREPVRRVLDGRIGRAVRTRAPSRCHLEPFVGPTLGAASVLAAQGDSLGQVALTMGAFGIGAALRSCSWACCRARR